MTAVLAPPVPPTPPVPPVPPVPPRRAAAREAPRPARISVAEYDRMVEAGVFQGPGWEGRRVELLDGELIEMAAARPPHAAAVSAAAEALRAVIPAGWCVREEKPIDLPTGRPEPDSAVANRAAKFWFARHPPAASLRLVLEVSDATLDHDRGRKSRQYAAAGLEPYVVVNLVEEVVHVGTGPLPPAAAAPPDGLAGYAETRTYGRGETVTFPLAGRPVGVPADEFLPPPPAAGGSVAASENTETGAAA